MKVHIKVHYIANGMKVLQQGDFKVNQIKYKSNPDEAAAESAKQFIAWIVRNNMYKVEIDKVLYNTTDITDLIKEAPLD